MSEIPVKTRKSAYLRRQPYADPWVGKITARDIFDSYSGGDGEYLFIWINKTAGVSVTKVLGIDKDAYNHYTATELRAILGTDGFDRAFTFCFVRNPWDRVVSEFRFRIWTYQNELTSDASFTDWVRSTYVDKNPRYHDWPKMFLPQLEWVTDENGDVIVDFIGRFETLQADFDKICDTINLERRVLRHENRSRHDDSYRSYYDDETRDIVARCFKSDIEYFGYEF